MRLKEAKIVGDFKVRVSFSDGTRGEANLEPLLKGEVYEPLRNAAYFRKMRFPRGAHTISWPNKADFAPEALYILAAMNPVVTKAELNALPEIAGESDDWDKEHVVVFRRPDGRVNFYEFSEAQDARGYAEWMKELGVPESRIAHYTRQKSASGTVAA